MATCLGRRSSLVMVQGLTSQKNPIFPFLLVPGAKVKIIEFFQNQTKKNL